MFNNNTPSDSGSSTYSAFGGTVFDQFRKLLGVKPGSFTLENVIGHHIQAWNTQQTYYKDLQDWYDGLPLDEKIVNSVTKEEVDKYPLHLNPIVDTCEKHTAVLFGNTLDGIRFGGVPIQFIVDDDDEKKVKAKKDDGEDAEEKDTEDREDGKNKIRDSLTKVFTNSGGGQTFLQNGIRSQYLGGSVWKVSYHPERVGAEVVVDTPSPTEFLGIPEPGNHNELREAWIIKEITIHDAVAYGYPMVSPTQNGPFYYIEYWSKTNYSIRINEWVITKSVASAEGETAVEAVRYEGENPFGVVPIVYIPHIRVNSFIGTSIITKTVKGLIKEMNLRVADIGDAVSEDAHSYVAIRNVRSAIKYQKLPDGRKVIDLGASAGLGAGGESQPDMIAVQPKSTSTPMLDFQRLLEKLYRRETKHPAVADGEDEGSQRSSLTLITRMWPMASHVDLERINWTSGLLQLCKIILTVMYIKGIDEMTEEDAKKALIIKWSQMLPKDREALLNEIAIRKSSNLGSPEHLIELLGDVYDVPAEIERIQDWIEWESKNAAPPSPFGGEPGEQDPTKLSAPKDPGGPKGENKKKPSVATSSAGE